MCLSNYKYGAEETEGWCNGNPLDMFKSWSGLDLGQVTDYPDLDFSWFFCLQANTGIVPSIGHSCCLPNFFYSLFIIIFVSLSKFHMLLS
jgi:hypothetical protein